MAWGLSKFLHHINPYFIDNNELPVEFNSETSNWDFVGAHISENYVSEEEQQHLSVEKCPEDLKKIFSNKKRMYFLLTNQLGMHLPTKDFCPKKFMWACVMGIKKYMTKEEDMEGLAYKEHKPGFVIKENSIKHWCGHLDEFPGWELYVPDPYIKKIKKQAAVADV